MPQDSKAKKPPCPHTEWRTQEGVYVCTQCGAVREFGEPYTPPQPPTG